VTLYGRGPSPSLALDYASNKVGDFENIDADKHQYFQRVENKRFSGFLLPEDLLAQLILLAFATQVNMNQEESYLAFRELVITARDLAVGPNKMWATIDLSKVLLN
jgi:hypothetical protein